MRYRDLLRESSLPVDYDTLEEIRADLSGWVGQHDASDAMFENIYAIWPRPASPMKLWRVDTLTREQGAEFERTGTVALQAWTFCSFTKSEAAKDRIARERAAEDRYTVVSFQEVPADRIVIDINAFADYIISLELDDPSKYDWDDLWEFRRFAHEEEVIVKTDGSLILTRANTKVVDFPESDEKPVVGGMAYRPHMEDGYIIRAVEEYRGNGYWRVDLNTGSGEMIYFDDGEWHIV